jgi:hypothetical protein
VTSREVVGCHGPDAGKAKASGCEVKVFGSPLHAQPRWISPTLIRVRRQYSGEVQQQTRCSTCTGSSTVEDWRSDEVR